MTRPKHDNTWTNKILTTTRVNTPLLFSVPQWYTLAVIEIHGIVIVQGWHVDHQQFCVSKYSSCNYHILTCMQQQKSEHCTFVKWGSRGGGGANLIRCKPQANFECDCLNVNHLLKKMQCYATNTSFFGNLLQKKGSSFFNVSIWTDGVSWKHKCQFCLNQQ